jgi:hypothetical protein
VLTGIVLAAWLAAVCAAVAAFRAHALGRAWRQARLAMPYAVFRAFAHRRGRWLDTAIGEEDRARYGSHLLHLDHPAVRRAHRLVVLSRVAGFLALGLAWPIRAMLPG